MSPLAPMRQVNLHEAKIHLSRRVTEAVAGEGFVICKADEPLVRVTRREKTVDAAPPRRRLGLPAGQCCVPDDMDAHGRGRHRGSP
ncbi:MAG: type II toxin-antitoxin system prevent-host-death family antitoxin [Cyanobacteriota bacterium]|nr:type II toxin-antitoxin system prevent-host-death family antitoxin [Cyanobacteriota bacterium]